MKNNSVGTYKGFITDTQFLFSEDPSDDYYYTEEYGEEYDYGDDYYYTNGPGIAICTVKDSYTSVALSL